VLFVFPFVLSGSWFFFGAVLLFFCRWWILIFVVVSSHLVFRLNLFSSPNLILAREQADRTGPSFWFRITFQQLTSLASHAASLLVRCIWSRFSDWLWRLGEHASVRSQSPRLCFSCAFLVPVWFYHWVCRPGFVFRPDIGFLRCPFSSVLIWARRMQRLLPPFPEWGFISMPAEPLVWLFARETRCRQSELVARFFVDFVFPIVDCCRKHGIIFESPDKRFEHSWFKSLFHGDFPNTYNRCSVKCLWWYKPFFESIFVVDLARSLASTIPCFRYGS
jgi:hypothetical protein